VPQKDGSFALGSEKMFETRMSLELCILASGSGGNCAVVRTPAGIVLIDAGIGPRTTAARMNGTGATFAMSRPSA